MPKRFNPICKKPPEDVEINGRMYKINSDFRTVFDFFELQAGEDTAINKSLLGMTLFFGQKAVQEDLPELYKKLIWFINKGAEREEEEEERKDITFDFLEDAGKIYAAFMQVYKINLRSVKMHWWIFLELFEGLPSGTHLSNVIELRGRKVEKGMSASDINALKKAQDYYRIGEPVDPMENVYTAIQGLAHGRRS